MNAEHSARRRPSGRLLLLLAYVLLVAVVRCYHEPWRDEADSWLMARDASFGELVRLAPYMGTPLLWYLLLAPLAKLGLPYVAQGALNALIAVGGASILLYRAPWSLGLRAAAVFSYFIAFEYAVIARSYALSMLLLFAVAALYPRRRERPLAYALLLVLLMNCNVHSLLLGGLLAGSLGLEMLTAPRQRNNLGPALLLGVGFLLTALQLIPPADGQVAVSSLTAGQSWAGVAHAVGNAFIPTRRLPWPALAQIGYLVNGFTLVALAVALARQPRLFFLYMAGLAGLLLLFSGVYYGGIRHAGLLGLWALTCAWLGAARDPDSWLPLGAPVLAAALGGSCLLTLHTAALDVRYAFSGARDMARFLIREHYAERPLAAYPDPVGEAVLAHLPRRTFWYAGVQREGSYMKWDREFSDNRNIPPWVALARVDQHWMGASHLLILFNQPIPQAERYGYRLLYKTQARVFTAGDEQYWLYERLYTIQPPGA